MNVPGGNIMNVTILQRSVARIDRPTVRTGMTPEHRVRPLIPSGDPKATDPFLLLMEDWFPLGVFDRHPHRGMETVTYVIDGRLDHYDNYGNKGSLLPGNVQWMTAGRGIIHNEQPSAGVTVHSLQLWVNLPAAGKMVEHELKTWSLPICRCGASRVLKSRFLRKVRRHHRADSELFAGDNTRSAAASRSAHSA